MKFGTQVLIGALYFSGVSAFAPASNGRAASTLAMSETIPETGLGGQAASSKEEDMALTLAIILAHDARSVTVSAEQFAVQVQEAATVVEEPEEVDLSIPYDATSQLAYESSDKSMAFDDFKATFLADAVADVIAKQPVDLSIPYDATSQLAYDSSDKSMSFAEFKTKFLADAVADVIAKKA